MRVTSRPVWVLHADQWLPGVLRSWEVDPSGHASAVVSYTDSRGDTEVGRFTETEIRDPRV